MSPSGDLLQQDIVRFDQVYAISRTTKAALRSFARNWAVDLKGKGIRVKCSSLIFPSEAN